MGKMNLKDMVKNLKERTGKMVEGEYEERPKKKVTEDTPVVEKEEIVETPAIEPEPAPQPVVEEFTPEVEPEDDIPADDIDAKIAEYYRKKKAKIAELEKLEEEETNKIIKKVNAYDEKKREYADIFNGITISKDDLDKENIGRAVLDEFTLKEEDFSDETIEDKLNAETVDNTTIGMDSTKEDKDEVKAEIVAETNDDIDNYIVETQVSGEYIPAKNLGKIDESAQAEIDTVIKTAKKKPAPKKDALANLTAKLNKKEEKAEVVEEKTEEKPVKKTTTKKASTTKSAATKKTTTAKKETAKKETASKTTKSTTKKTTTKSTTAKKSTTKKTTTKKVAEETSEGIKLTAKEMNELVKEVMEAPLDAVETAPENTVVENAVAENKDTAPELTEGWTVDDYNKLVGIKEDTAQVEEKETVSKDGTLDSEVKLNETDIEHLEKAEEEKTAYFYGSKEHKENEEENKSTDTANIGKEVELGDRNLNKDIANATPSSEVIPMGEEKVLTEEERFAREMEFIYTIFGVQEKSKSTEKEQRKVLYVAAESQPFVATGGLADVAGSLPNAIAELGVDIRVIMPLYGTIKDMYRKDFEFLGNFTVHLSWRQEYCGLFRYYRDGVTYYFIDNERYFKRPNVYGYYDDGERYAYFCRAVVECLPHIDFFPDIIHCNDWQTALVPTYIKTGEWADHRYYQIKHIYTIHNVEYQGIYGMENLKDLFGIDERYTHDMEYDGTINLTKAAIQLADKVTTVSRSYCNDLLQPYCSRGLHHIIHRNAHKLQGIINGINYDFYNPETDKTINHNFTINTLEEKKKCKKAWQEELGLPVDPETPMLSMVTRLVSHKGLDLIVKIMEDLLQDDIQFVIVGTGDQRFIEYFRYLEDKYPTKVRALVDKFSLEYGVKNYGGSDIFLMPSKIEPCGISQMVSSRYGAVPIVRECGGLKDTITDFGCEQGGNGYTFTHYNSEDLKYQIKRAIRDYRDKEGWTEKMKIVMSQDFSWSKSAKEYIDLYESVLN